MQLLTVDDEGCYFLIDGDEIKPEELSKDNLLKLFNKMYEEGISEVQIPEVEEINSIRNPVEKEIVKQIIEKVKEFVSNLEQMKKDIESSFPSLNPED
ncbi:hypothetical protein [Streptococcus sp. sy004]|uniref:hypothetical protein n=1 Tax=Streptococcus sp. sy004 TaxID=2600149 RepID=UPI0011B727DD|nr:hypothetical protein [Streptococcus sp. sy004]TWT11319.1 hypothetical protein FRX54_03480 [Streptococcus sp. sy004]